MQEQPIFPLTIRFKHLSHKLLFSPFVFPVGKSCMADSSAVSTLIQQNHFWVSWWKTPPLNQKVNPLLSELKVKMSSKIFLGWLLGIIVRRVPWLLDLTCILTKQETAPNIHFWFRACTPCYRAVLYLLKPLACIWGGGSLSANDGVPYNNLSKSHKCHPIDLFTQK